MLGFTSIKKYTWETKTMKILERNTPGFRNTGSLIKGYVYDWQ